MKKFIPVLFFIMAFTGFLSTQILWDTLDLNATHVDQDKQKHSAYESAFQGLNISTTKSTSIELKNLKEPIVVLNFWASWCLPCLKEFPSLVKFQDRYKGKVRVIGINGDEDDYLSLIQKTEAKYSLNFESATDPQSSISDKFLVNSYPVSLIFHKGKILYVSKKINDFMEPSFIEMIDDALKAK